MSQIRLLAFLLPVFTPIVLGGCAILRPPDASGDLARFRAENPGVAPGGVVLLGDSLTYGFPEYYFFPGAAIANRGVPGARVRDVRRQLDVSVLEIRPSRTLLMVGINDLLAHGRSNDQIVEDYRRLLDALAADHRPGRVYVQSIMPLGEQFFWANPRIRAINRRLRVLAYQRGMAWIDVHSGLVDASGNLSAGYTLDGVHLNGVGCATWAALITPVVTQQPAVSPSRIPR